MRILLLDNFDSFTHTLADYLRQLGADVIVQRNDVSLRELQAVQPAAVVLSPGPGVPGRAGVMPAAIAHFHQRVPMLGVCLGHQALGEFFGAKLVRAARPMHGKVADISCDEESALFAGLPGTMPVTRYHSLLLADPLPPALRVLARTTGPEAEIMAFEHRQWPLHGVQFHPEALLTPHGLAILGNWLRCCIIAQAG